MSVAATTVIMIVTGRRSNARTCGIRANRRDDGRSFRRATERAPCARRAWRAIARAVARDACAVARSGPAVASCAGASEPAATLREYGGATARRRAVALHTAPPAHLWRRYAGARSAVLARRSPRRSLGCRTSTHQTAPLAIPHTLRPPAAHRRLLPELDLFAPTSTVLRPPEGRPRRPRMRAQDCTQCALLRGPRPACRARALTEAVPKRALRRNQRRVTPHHGGNAICSHRRTPGRPRR